VQSARPSLAVRWAAVSERLIWLAAADLLGHVFACLLWSIGNPFSVGGTGDAFFNAFVPAAKAPIGRAYEEGGHAQRHQSLAVGIGADALGGLCQLAELPDALRSGTRLRMCTVHDREPELGRLPLLRKSLPAPTAHALIETCGCDYVLSDLARYFGRITRLRPVLHHYPGRSVIGLPGQPGHGRPIRPRLARAPHYLYAMLLRPEYLSQALDRPLPRQNPACAAMTREADEDWAR
jgi:hypothetical protein